MTTSRKIVLLRHGESTWNMENLFTGWVDVELTEKGRQEAVRAGQLMREAGYVFDMAFTSVLKRAILTLWLALEEMNQCWVPVVNHWRLNERHYGALQGKNKAQAAEQYGDAQVHLWRRSFDVRPPQMTLEKAQEQRTAPYFGVAMPQGECLKDTVERVLPFWHNSIAPLVAAGKTLLLSAHGNSLRALVKYLDNISDKDISALNIPNGVPLVYELNEDLKPLNHYYLGNKN